MTDEATFEGARRDKRRAYPELVAASDRLHFVILATEVGGRFSPEASSLVSDLVTVAAAKCAPLLQRSFRLIYYRRWWGLLSIAAQRAVARNLLGFDGLDMAPCGVPSLEVLLSIVEAPQVSRLA